MLHTSVKEKDPLKVGRFGLGFKSVFHLTGEILPTFFIKYYINVLNRNYIILNLCRYLFYKILVLKCVTGTADVLTFVFVSWLIPDKNVSNWARNITHNKQYFRENSVY